MAHVQKIVAKNRARAQERRNYVHKHNVHPGTTHRDKKNDYARNARTHASMSYLED